MIWINLKNWFGFKKPYNFRVASVFIINFTFLVIILISYLYYLLTNQLDIGTSRYYFFVYLILLLSISTALSGLTLFSLCLFFWCAIDFSVAILSIGLNKYGISSLLMPPNKIQTLDLRFKYHPLLQATPKPNFRSITGTRFIHNAEGLRGNDVSTRELNRKLIFFYGGSTTYDIGVNQGETWVEDLQRKFGNMYLLLNYGVPGYSTTENLVQTAFYQNFRGKKPICAVYYIGWNDIRNAHIPNLDEAYADYHLLSQISNLSVRKPEIAIAKYSPMISWLYAQIKKRVDTIPYPPKLSVAKNTDTNGGLDKIFVEHINTIVAINKSRGVKTVFIGQILNKEKLTGNQTSDWLPLVKDKDAWLLQSHFNSLLQAKSEQLGVNYIDPGINNFNNSDFVDSGHFSATGSAKFAQLTYSDIKKGCQ